ncbi:hypothetical protein Scep_010548 [Stephania cephalantha]|uniref:Uncharacterized protein n=1 Tax=Stephania cephalantha TaxID=152367 RepID=A0AAP0JXQ4_9MAGN
MVIPNAETGSVAMKAEELGATWVILDRRLKKEGDYCSKQLNCNIILVDHTVKKILRLVDEQIELRDQQYDPMALDMLAAFPTSNIRSNSVIYPSSLGFNGCSPRTEVSDSLPSTGDKNSACKNINNQQTKASHPRYSEFITHQTTPSYSKSQPLQKVSRFVYDEKSQKTSAINLNMERRKNYSGPLESENTGTHAILL